MSRQEFLVSRKDFMELGHNREWPRPRGLGLRHNILCRDRVGQGSEFLCRDKVFLCNDRVWPRPGISYRDRAFYVTTESWPRARFSCRDRVFSCRDRELAKGRILFLR